MFSFSYLNVSAQCSNISLSFNDKFLVKLGHLTLLVQAQDNKAVCLYEQNEVLQIAIILQLNGFWTSASAVHALEQTLFLAE